MVAAHNHFRLYIFPHLSLPVQTLILGEIRLIRRGFQNVESGILQPIIDRAFGFLGERDEGVYCILGDDHTNSTIPLFVRYLSYTPDFVESSFSPINSRNIFDCYVFWVFGDEQEFSSIVRNDIEIWGGVFDGELDPRIFHISWPEPKSHTVGFSSDPITNTLSELLFSTDASNHETSDIGERIRRSIYWYNKSCEIVVGGRASNRFMRGESQILYMALAFESLFQPPPSEVYRHLEASLKTVFPDNEFIPKWLRQFYDARSAVAHGSSLEGEKFYFRPDKSKHDSLIYWSRKVFRASVEATISQWKISRNSGLLNMMTPNRVKLNRILGRLKDKYLEIKEFKYLQDVHVDIGSIYLGRFDYPDEGYLHQTGEITSLLFRKIAEFGTMVDDDLALLIRRVAEYPDNWYRHREVRLELQDDFIAILSLFEDEEPSIMNSEAELSSRSDLEKLVYRWVKFAYGHIWIIDEA